MRRLVLLGAAGYFGTAAAALLRQMGVPFVAAGRGRAAELKVDAERPDGLREGDVVLDAAGPFQRRTAALFEAAIEKRFDVVDLSDSLAYAKMAVAMALRFERAGIRVITACSSASAVSAALVRAAGVREPVAVRVYLAAASRRSARYGTSASALDSLGREIEVWREGKPGAARGWGEPRKFEFPAPVGCTTCRLVEFPDTLFLPREFPTLALVESRAATRIRGLDALLAVAGRIPGFPSLIRAALFPATVAMLRPLGREGGGVGVEVVGSKGETKRVTVSGSTDSHFVAVAPAVLAARRLSADSVRSRGLVPASHAVADAELLDLLRSRGVILARP
jgi:hypothetical protein